MKKLFFASVTFILVFSSCKKDDPTPTCQLSNTTILGTYKTTASTVQANATATPVDDFATWDACQKDDLMTFNAAGTVSTSEGATSCTPPNTSVTANWTLSGSNLTISLPGVFTETATIIDFNCTTMKVKTVDATTGEITITTLTKQ
jgi:hypothetical protein